MPSTFKCMGGTDPTHTPALTIWLSKLLVSEQRKENLKEILI